MSFFKSKEEVIDLQLTPYGKQTLAKGVFKPTYYAFFDDDIIYDSMAYSVTELQNDTQTRVLESTPYLKTQYKFSGSSVNSLEELDYSRYLGIPLADADDSIQYLPSFNISFVNGTIDRVDLSSSLYYNNLGNESIPQIYLKTEYVDIIIDKDYSKAEMNTKEIFYPPKQDDSYVKVSPKEIVFDIFEENVEYLFKNFDIEVHKIQNGIIEKLKFEKSIMSNDSAIIDDMLVPGVISDNDLTFDVTPTSKFSDFQTFTEEDTHMVKSYFNIITDDMQEDFKPNRLYIYDPMTDISPKGNNC
jgi:hypothetical protein